MNRTIKRVLKDLLVSKTGEQDFDILIPPNLELGDYSTNIAFVLSKKGGEDPVKVAEDLAAELAKDKELADIFEKVKAVKPGFVNFYLNDDFVRSKFKEVAGESQYGFNDTMKGETVIVEYTDPNPFKLFHIGHLMSNTIGEAIARLYEACGAKVLRVTWQGDVGMHIAMAVWAIKTGRIELEKAEGLSLEQKIDYLGKAYSVGSAAFYGEDAVARREIGEINQNIYDKNNSEVNEIYNLGRRWSLDYFEKIYQRLGSKFDHYFFESELGPKGLEIVKNHPEVFESSDGAIIFRGENYGLHTRVFVNSSGLPVYEAKELGLNKEKFDLYKPDLSIIVTGNEINEYFKVLLKVMDLVMPEVASKTRHIGHGMLRLPSGKMSSRTGSVITADSLIEQTKGYLPAQAGLPGSEKLEVAEVIAIGAIKYSILKQSSGHDIIFDFEKSLSIKGDSGPYLQYTYARLSSILKKSERSTHNSQPTTYNLLNHPLELKLIKRILMFPDVVLEACRDITPQHLVLYLYELANDANRFYESVRVLDDENKERKNARLVLVETVSEILKRGLNLLGIEAPERI